MLKVIMLTVTFYVVLNVTRLIDVMLNAFLLSVVAPPMLLSITDNIKHTSLRCHDTQHNDTQHKGIICDIQYNDIQHNDT